MTGKTLSSGQMPQLIWLGSGSPPIIAIHGIGMDHTYLRPFLDPLSTQTSLIYFDQRGCGQAQLAGELSREHWISDLDAILTAVRDEPVVLFGHSQGGVLALEYALTSPERIAGLVLCNTFASPRHLPQAIARLLQSASPADVQALTAAFSRAPASDEDLRQIWQTILPHYFHSQEIMKQAALLDCIRFSAAGWGAFLTSWLPGYDVSGQLGQLHMPTLVIAGRYDVIASAEAQTDLVQGIPAAELVVMEESGHFPFIEEQERFIRIVSDWLARLGARREN